MKTVLFVCFHNSGRSQMAEAFVKHFAEEGNIQVRAMSAGTVNSRDINPVVRKAMDEIGVSMKGQHPKQMMQWHVDGADRVITMHCKVDPGNCPRRLGECEDWELEDPAGKSIEEVRLIRDEIRQRVQILLLEMDSHSAEGLEH